MYTGIHMYKLHLVGRALVMPVLPLLTAGQIDINGPFYYCIRT